MLEMTSYIESFINDFEKKFDKKIQINITEENSSIKIKTWKDELDALSHLNHLSKIKLLESLVLQAIKIHTNIKIKSLSNITTRRRNYILWVQCFSYMAWKIGMSKSAIGRLLNKNHATIIHSIKTVEALLSINEREMTQTYNRILKQIKDYVGTISGNAEEQNNTESIFDTLWDQKQNVYTRIT